MALELKDTAFEDDKSVYLVPAVNKALHILELLKTEEREMTIAEIAKSTGWHMSSVQNCL